jgi:hypothetical protein
MMLLFQEVSNSSVTDTGIHLTMSGAIVALIVDKVWDKMRGSGAREILKEQKEIMKEQNEILREMAKDIAVLKDRRMRER